MRADRTVCGFCLASALVHLSGDKRLDRGSGRFSLLVTGSMRPRKGGRIAVQVMPTISTRLRRAALIALIALVVSAVGVYVWMLPSGQLEIHDSRLQVLSWRISRSTNHMMYPGRQLEGRFKHWIDSKLGLGIGDLPVVQASAPTPDSRALLIHYRGEFPVDELDKLTALIRSEDGSILQTVGGRFLDRGSGTFYKVFLVLGTPVAEASYTVEFSLPSSKKPVATWYVKSL